MNDVVWRSRFDDELRQAAEEGVVVDAVRARAREAAAFDEARYRDLTRELQTAPRRGGHVGEPSTWERIVDTLEEPPAPRGTLPDDLDERAYAAWLGRGVGCMFGAPFRGWNATRIRRALEAADAWPLRAYAAAIAGADRRAVDPALSFPVLALGVLERIGGAVTAGAIADAWLERIAGDPLDSAERAALGNLRAGFRPPDSAIRYNPYREWVGAQPRAGVWGYAMPGDPLRAARLAFEDASVSHVKNGVYGAMFFAAGMAAAFDAHAPEDVVDAGLRCIPPESRLADAILEIVRWAEEDDRWETTLHRIVARFGRYHWEHAIPNALVVLNALVHGRGSFADTVSIAVSSGFDTAANGATAGSIAGVLYGAHTVPDALREPLGDRVSTFVKREKTCDLHDLAMRTARVARDLAVG